MATLQEQRQAIAAGMAASRQATGGDERRAIGQRLIEERTGKAVVEDLNRLTAPGRPRSNLSPVSPVGSLPAAVGRGEYKKPAATTGGIASPLVERPDTRTFHEAKAVWSSDGFMPLLVKRVATVSMLDANAEAVELEFENVP
jgi:hypothetical protein